MRYGIEHFDILDYKGKKVKVVLDMTKVEAIWVNILSGDEILIVRWLSGKVEKFDSNDTRFCDFIDGNYIIYDIENIDIIDEWQNYKGTSSYDRLDLCCELFDV